MKKKTGNIWSMQFVTSCISTTMVLILLGMVMFFVLSARNLSVYVRESINFSILMSDDVRETDILKFKKDLGEKVYVKESQYISKKDALKEHSEAMGADPEKFLGYNPFSASLEVKLNSAYANSDSLKWIEKEIKKNKGVTEIVYPQALMDAVNSNIRKISVVLLGIAALLTLVSFALINNTIRLTIYSRRFLIHTMTLVGASWGFIRRPFLLRNVRVGILSGLLANGVLWGGLRLLLRYEPELTAVITPGVMTQVALTVLLFGVVITFLCAYLSINRYLRMCTNKLYQI